METFKQCPASLPPWLGQLPRLFCSVLLMVMMMWDNEDAVVLLLLPVYVG